MEADSRATDGSYLHQGLSAEYLVASELTKLGYAVSVAAEGLAYDLLVDIGDRVLRVQVKSTEGMRLHIKGQSTVRYKFRLRTSGRPAYSKQAFDICALVASDTGLIAYMTAPEVIGKYCLLLRGPDQPVNSRSKRDKGIHELPFYDAVARLVPEKRFSLDEELTKAFGARS